MAECRYKPIKDIVSDNKPVDARNIQCVVERNMTAI